MSLDPSYLQYARRRRGMDHDLYSWSNLFSRPPVHWPGAAAVAIWPVISLEWFPIVAADKPFRAPGHMQTPYPDYRHYTARDYGTRVGLFRLLDAFEKRALKVSVAVNAAVARRVPEVIADIRASGHEIVAHAVDMNDTIATGVSEERERAIIGASFDLLEAVSGERATGWLSIARSQSWNTPRLLAEAGVAYMCDWVNDELPFAVSTEAGSILNLPLNHELSDRQIILVQQQSVESYVEQVRDAYTWLASEAQMYGGRMLPLHLTPYILGLPYRADAIEQLLDWLVIQPGSWFAQGADICRAVQGGSKKR